MKRLRKWLIERFFPAVAKETIARLEQEVARKDAELASLNSYIDGMEFGMRAQRRLIINNEVKK